MAQQFAIQFYNSTAWKKCRAAYIRQRKAIDGGLCERCKSDLGYIVHHKRHLTPKNITNQAVTLNFDNLQYVCKNCHDNEHFYNNKYVAPEKQLLCGFDDKGKPIKSVIT